RRSFLLRANGFSLFQWGSAGGAGTSCPRFYRCQRGHVEIVVVLPVAQLGWVRPLRCAEQQSFQGIALPEQPFAAPRLNPGVETKPNQFAADVANPGHTESQRACVVPPGGDEAFETGTD